MDKSIIHLNLYRFKNKLINYVLFLSDLIEETVDSQSLYYRNFCMLNLNLLILKCSKIKKRETEIIKSTHFTPH